MSKTKIWLSAPHMGGEEQSFIAEAFDTNWIAPLGPNVTGFEEDLQSYNGVGHAAALSSGTAALHLGLKLLGVGRGDLVLVQSFTFCASAHPVMYSEATPVFIDSEPDTWNMCPVNLRKAIEAIQNRGELHKVKAILPVHLYGMPAKLNELKAISEEYSIPILEDAAESLGSTYNGKYTGTFGELGVYSFNGNKIITTSGGGALVSNNEAHIAKARYLATQAREPAPHYEHVEVGYNYRLSNILAGIGRGQMKVLNERIKQRRSVFSKYVTYFENLTDKGYSIEFQVEPAGVFANRWLSAILIDPAKNKGIDRETLRLAFEQENIEARPLWKPMHLQPVYSNSEFFGDRVAEDLFAHGLCLPSCSSMTDSDWDRIVAVLDQVFEG
ncbi:DegT/DnrJ/EryC1/StrS family aminotransferase [Phaeocystidibacter luteus]|uniref:GDP-perosamine synthase n=1 Tax=Phaeocystidibacter luteus TaxID=911197 RepID=A0A6N6RL20_9FLAO|nr:DegT/DnrJ/EryC1/StrS family aminotransferase [Phaeocystidibacter luteus]KAB2814337.1 pyridoxal phosphate-dependent aminotransferase [Phaeocystidibacter luteus]